MLLEALVAAVGNDTDASLRDYAAKVRLRDHPRDSQLILCRLRGQCLAEFFRWSMKHAVAVGAANAATHVRAFNVDSMLRRVYALARHPDPNKRYGTPPNEWLR